MHIYLGHHDYTWIRIVDGGARFVAPVPWLPLPADRCRPLRGQVLSQSVTFWAAVAVVGLWYLLISAPVVVEELLEWSPRGMIK